ncbi:hypothetical protein M2281_003766 [Mesorhizobium soli]|nr:hypothetical protein [Mesorhizobium soli]
MCVRCLNPVTGNRGSVHVALGAEICRSASVQECAKAVIPFTTHLGHRVLATFDLKAAIMLATPAKPSIEPLRYGFWGGFASVRAFVCSKPSLFRSLHLSGALGGAFTFLRTAQRWMVVWSIACRSHHRRQPDRREAIVSCDTTHRLQKYSLLGLEPIRQGRYLNKRIEQDHRRIRRRVRPMLALSRSQVLVPFSTTSNWSP